MHGYQFILGLGTGLTFSSVTMMTNLAHSGQNMGECLVFCRSLVRTDDCWNSVAAAQGAVNQSRILGGSIGLAVATIIFNDRLSKELSGILDNVQLRNLKQSLNTIGSLDPSEQAAVSTVYAKSFNQQMRFCTYLSAACVVAALGTFSKTPASVKAAREKQDAISNETDSGESG